MKTIVITSTDEAISFWENLFMNLNFNYLILTINEYYKHLFSIKVEEEVYAVVIDRVTVDLDNIKNVLKKVDFFIINNSLRAQTDFSDSIELANCHFYNTPFNKTILLDDLKSITKIKDYMKFGSINIGQLILNINMRTLQNAHKSVFLKNKEFDLLWFMANNMGKVLSRTVILDHVWDMNANVVTNTVDVHISRIRKILKNEFGVSSLIKTVPCSGYVLTEVYGE